MLVLSRKVGERIAIGDDIVLTVVRIGGNKVSVGIEAPRKLSVRRDELPPHEILEHVLAAGPEDHPADEEAAAATTRRSA